MKIKQDVRSVYVIYNEELKRTKIGYSSNSEKRFESIMSQSGCRMRLIYFTKPIYNYADVEKNMHRLFEDKRGIGEWFHMSYEKAVQRLKGLVSDKDTCRIVKHYESGKSSTEIGYLMGVSRSGIIKYLKSKGYMLHKHEKITIARCEIRNKDITHTNISSNKLVEMVKLNELKRAKS